MTIPKAIITSNSSFLAKQSYLSIWRSHQSANSFTRTKLDQSGYHSEIHYFHLVSLLVSVRVLSTAGAVPVVSRGPDLTR